MIENTYQKSSPLSDEDKWRLSIVAQVHSQLQIDGDLHFQQYYEINNSGQNSSSAQRMAKELVSVLKSETQKMKPDLLLWIIHYGSIDMLRKLKEVFTRIPAQMLETKLLEQINPDILLPLEYINPDLQIISNSQSFPETALICFTGNSHKMNIPLQLFHNSVADKFDLIVYLRDIQQQKYTKGIVGLASNLNEIQQVLRNTIPHGCHISIMGCSGGGIAASLLAQEFGAERLALFSPAFEFKGIKAVAQHVVRTRTAISLGNVRIYFSNKNKLDILLKKKWNGTCFRKSIRWLNTDSHSTLKIIVENGQFYKLIDWVQGGAEPNIGSTTALIERLKGFFCLDKTNLLKH